MLVLGIILSILGGVGLLTLKGSKPVIIDGDTEEETAKKEKAYQFWLKRKEIAFALFVIGLLLVFVSVLIMALM